MTIPNRLSKALSPYLRQHANNPVDWYPWGEEALEKAKRENKPILLSIGYAACHWCHVMAHESFEDEEIAKFMNESFINIKVDREERPDIDKIYQLAHQLLNQHPGGWPLTAFLTPDDRVPFFIGTYFPSQPRYQLPSFLQLMQRIKEIYQTRMNEIKQQNQSLVEYLQKINQTTSDQAVITSQPFKLAQEQLYELYDEKNGGFGSAPKFPQSDYLFFLLQQLTDDPQRNSKIVIHSLACMAQGGIFDQIGGGFFRYSVDERWEIPHFEKMLYDNARLIMLYINAAIVFDKPELKMVAERIASWVLREMQSSEGAFYSSLNADSEGKEGLYYVWQREEIESLLTHDEYVFAKSYYNLSLPANFESAWHLYIVHPDLILEKLRTIDEKLLQVRAKRIPPSCDDKILTSWNALMVQGLLQTGICLENKNIIEAAKKGFSFLIGKMFDSEHVWAVYKNGTRQTKGFLDDYVFLIRTIILFLQYEWSNEHFNQLNKIVETVIQLFHDQQGGFFFTSSDGENLFVRPKMWSDEALPSANGIFIHDLIKLSFLLAKPNYFVLAEQSIQSIWSSYIRHPSAYGSLSQAIAEYIEPAEIIVLRGPEKELWQWQKIHFENYPSRRWVFAIPNELANVPAFFADKKSSDHVVAYLCKGTLCYDAITNLEEYQDVVRKSAICFARKN